MARYRESDSHGTLAINLKTSAVRAQTTRPAHLPADPVGRAVAHTVGAPASAWTGPGSPRCGNTGLSNRQLKTHCRRRDQSTVENSLPFFKGLGSTAVGPNGRHHGASNDQSKAQQAPFRAYGYCLGNNVQFSGGCSPRRIRQVPQSTGNPPGCPAPGRQPRKGTLPLSGCFLGEIHCCCPVHWAAPDGSGTRTQALEGCHGSPWVAFFPLPPPTPSVSPFPRTRQDPPCRPLLASPYSPRSRFEVLAKQLAESHCFRCKVYPSVPQVQCRHRFANVSMVAMFARGTFAWVCGAWEHARVWGRVG
jgi:hypothetical protein